MQRDNAAESFARLRKAGTALDSETWTESDTRSKLIDTLLIDCLGWREEHIRRELSAEGLRLDYRLALPQPALVIEAKRASFDLKVTRRTDARRIRLDRLIENTPSTHESLNQVAQYAWTWGCPLAVLTNGRTYILFIAVRTDGTPWREGDAVVIHDIFDPSFDFASLWDLLSRDALLERRPNRALLDDPTSVEPVSVVSTYDFPEAVLPGNPLGLALEPLLRSVFTDVTDRASREVLEHCYVLPGETRLRDEEFEALLLDTPPAYIGSFLSLDSKNAYNQFRTRLKELFGRDSLAQTLLVVGGVGVGKTMFLQRYFGRPGEPEHADSATIPLFIDFRAPTELDPTRVPDFVFESLREQILQLDAQCSGDDADGRGLDLTSYDGLRQVFRSEELRYARGPKARLRESAPPEYELGLIELLEDLQKRPDLFVPNAIRTIQSRYHRRVCVVLDNADQCAPEYQAAVYLFARALEAKAQCLVVVALREEWYWHFGKAGGPLSAYHDIVFHVPAPRTRDVLQKRLDYAIGVAEKSGPPTASVQIAGNIHLEAQHLVEYLRACRMAFFEDDAISLFFECMSNGNIRRGLEIFLDYVRSGHTRVEEYLRAFGAGRKYVLLFHQVFKPVACGSYAYYAQVRSKVPNVFVPDPTEGAGRRLHLSRLYQLLFLDARACAATSAGRGFVPMGACIELLRRLGHSESGATELLRSLVAGELIESDVRLVRDLRHWSYLRITAFGRYMCRDLVGRVAYLEATMLDTPMEDAAVRARLAGIYQEGVKPGILHRLEGVRTFVDWLKCTEARERRDWNADLAVTLPAIGDRVREAARRECDEIAARDVRARAAEDSSTLF